VRNELRGLAYVEVKGWRRFLLFSAKTVTARNARHKATYLPEANKQSQPQPAATRRRAKLWQAVDALLLNGTELQRSVEKRQKQTK
jgi:hypothetical protein